MRPITQDNASDLLDNLLQELSKHAVHTSDPTPMASDNILRIMKDAADELQQMDDGNTLADRLRDILTNYEVCCSQTCHNFFASDPLLLSTCRISNGVLRR